jgi:hypothetical protein
MKQVTKAASIFGKYGRVNLVLVHQGRPSAERDAAANGDGGPDW